MLWSRSLIPTMKETPEGAEIPSHVLMLRAGLINQVMAGAYTYLPLGLRALKKAERIVRRGMDAAGAVEILMPALTPIGLFEQSGRIQAFGDVLIKFEVKRQNRKVHMALGPTHEETITDLVSRQVSSYRQMPLTMYQIQTKFRNEERPRFGVLRTSEFVMKDAYSFDATVEGLNKSYDAMYGAYCRIFSECGLDYLAVEAESGPIGGDASHEFMVLADNGEDTVLHCKDCGYAANQEKAEIGIRERAPSKFAPEDLKKVTTPGAATIEQVTKFLKVLRAANDQDADLHGRRQADRRALARRSRCQRGQDSPRGGRCENRTCRSGGHPTSDRCAGRLRWAGWLEAADCGLRRPRDRRHRQRHYRRQRGRNAPYGRQSRPRLPADEDRRPAKRNGRRPLPALHEQAGHAARHRGRPRLQARHEVFGIA